MQAPRFAHSITSAAMDFGLMGVLGYCVALTRAPVGATVIIKGSNAQPAIELFTGELTLASPSKAVSSRGVIRGEVSMRFANHPLSRVATKWVTMRAPKFGSLGYGSESCRP